MNNPSETVVTKKIIVWGAAFLFCASMAGYIMTLCPSVYWLDSGELQAAVPILGIPHSPSFPSYILSSHFMCWLPFGDIAYRVNSATALAGALVGVLSFFLVLSLVGRTWAGFWSAIFVGLSVTMNPLIWFQNLKAEVYSLNMAFLLGVLILSVDILNSRDLRPKVFKRLCFIAILFGLGGSNHSLLTAHLVPSLFVLCFFVWSKLRFRDSLFILSLFILTSSIYIYLPIRSIGNPWIDLGNPENFMNFFNGISRRGSFGRFFGSATSEWLANWRVYFELLTDYFSISIFVMALIGFLILMNRSFRPGLLLFVAASANVSITLINRNFNMNPDTGPAYLMLSTVILIVFSGIFLFALISKLMKTVHSQIIPTIAICMMVVIPFAWAIENIQKDELTQDYSAGLVAKGILDTCPENSILYYGMYYNLPFIMSYLQAVENYRKDVIIFSRGEIVYWPGGLENARKRHPDLTDGVFSGSYGEMLQYLAPRSSRHSGTVISFEHARDLLFNTNAWMAQEQSRDNFVFWFSSEDDHLLQQDFEPYGPMLKLGDKKDIDERRQKIATEVLIRRTQIMVKPDFVRSQGLKALAAFYDLQCQTLMSHKMSTEARSAHLSSRLFDPFLAGNCDLQLQFK